MPGDNTSLLFQPLMAAVRADPRFIRLATGFGLAAYWRASSHWPDFCDEACRRAMPGAPAHAS
jgi:hypothetical protein